MKLFGKIPWQHDDRNYEIRLLYDDRTITVAAFLNNHPANGYRYQVKLPKNCDARSVLQKNPVTDLVECCKRDVLENRWQTLRKTIMEAKSDCT
jgi:hypothetical protein